ncbi:tail protein from Bacteriophage (fragment) [Escherichia coli]
MIWQPEFTDKTLSRKPGAVQVVLRNLIEQAWGKVLGEDNSITHLVVYPEVLSLVFDAANTYNAEPGVLEQTARAYIESHGAIERHLGCSDF